MQRVLIPSKVAPEMLEILRGYPDLEVDAPGNAPSEELRALLATADGVIIRSNNVLTRELIDGAPRLRVIGRAGVGLDNVDVEAATRRGIVVMNTPGENSIATAEHTFAMLMALARRIPAADRSVKEGRWERGRFQGVELFGKTLGIVGLGKIGMIVGKRAQAFGMHVLAFDPFVTPEMVRDEAIRLVNLEELLGTADFITVHTPLVAKTRHLIGAPELGLVKSGVRILNCARGGIVDEEALCDAIERGTVAGAALDVFEAEPPREGRVTRYDEIICTPHLGGSTAEAQRNVGIAIARQVGDFLTRGVVEHAANAAPVTGETRALLGPYFDICERMGSLAAQILSGPPQRLLVAFHGERFRGDVEILVAAALKGVLSVAMEGFGVNPVNARALARDRGLEVSVVRGPEREDFSNLVRVRIESQGDAHEITGTQFGKHGSHIVAIDDFPLEIEPRGWMIVALSANEPGIIGRMGTIVGRHGGNIHKMNNGCSPDGRAALSTMSLDEEPPPALVDELGREPYFHWIRLVRL
jgi:D-3-phosphoglycerate dehydrogenase / 2-oxoglutarate reductase